MFIFLPILLPRGRQGSLPSGAKLTKGQRWFLGLFFALLLAFYVFLIDKFLYLRYSESYASEGTVVGYTVPSFSLNRFVWVNVKLPNNTIAQINTYTMLDTCKYGHIGATTQIRVLPVTNVLHGKMKYIYFQGRNLCW